MRILMAHVDDPDQIKIDTYLKNGGYQAIKKEIAPADLVEMVKQSGLRGTGRSRFCHGSQMGLYSKRGKSSLFGLQR